MTTSNKYHPFRFQQSRPFARQAATAYVSVCGAATPPTSKVSEKLSAIVQRGYNDALEDIPRLERPDHTRIVFSEISYTMHYAIYCAYGRNTFDFDESLISMFRNTDVGAVPIESLQLPFNAVYLSFGPQNDLLMFGGKAVIDGAYVRHVVPKTMEIALSVIPVNGWSPVNPSDFITDPDRNYYLPLPFIQGLSVEDAIEQALNNQLKAKATSNATLEAFGEVQKEAKQDGIEIRSSHLQSSQIFSEEIKEGYAVFKKAMNLVVNGLCYLTAYHDDGKTEWPVDAPSSMVDKVATAKTPKQKQRAESKLRSQGYSRVHFARETSEKAAQSTGDAVHENVRTHWRRGHWRNQPCGSNRMETKLIWIKPVLVAKKEDAEPDGHVYDVRRSDASPNG